MVLAFEGGDGAPAHADAEGGDSCAGAAPGGPAPRCGPRTAGPDPGGSLSAVAGVRFTASTGASPEQCGSVAGTPVAVTLAKGSRPVASRPSSWVAEADVRHIGHRLPDRGDHLVHP